MLHAPLKVVVGIIAIILLQTGCSAQKVGTEHTVQVETGEEIIETLELSDAGEARISTAPDAESRSRDNKDDASGKDVGNKEENLHYEETKAETIVQDVKEETKKDNTPEIVVSKPKVNQKDTQKDGRASPATNTQSAAKSTTEPQEKKIETPVQVQVKPEAPKPSEAPQPDAARVAEEAAPEESKTTVQRYKDGVYYGFGNGHAGKIEVEVSVEKGQIHQIQVLEHKDTKNLASTVFRQLTKLITSTQQLDVDIVSGATSTSKGFIEAVKDSLK